MMPSRPPVGASAVSPMASCSTTRSRPSCLACSRASSARRRIVASSSPGSHSVTPKLTVNLGSPPTVMAASSWARSVLSARAASTAEQSGKAMANSSPP